MKNLLAITLVFILSLFIVEESGASHKSALTEKEATDVMVNGAVMGTVNSEEAITPAWALDNYDNITVEVTTPGYFDVRMH